MPATSAESVQMEAAKTLPVETEKVVQLSAEASAYNEAVDLFKNEEYGKAAIAFAKLGDYRDAKEISLKIWEAIAARETISANSVGIAIVRNDGTVVSLDYGNRAKGIYDVSAWSDIISVDSSSYHTIGLRSDGTVVATGWNRHGQCNVSDWTDIVSISTSNYNTIGLRSDGTVVVTNSADYNEHYFSNWTDVVAVAAGDPCAVVLRSNGVAMVVDYTHNTIDQWTDIQAISSAWGHTVGLRNDGTVVERISDTKAPCDISAWADITKVSAADQWRADSGSHVVGLCKDGTTVAAGNNKLDQCNISEWTNIEDVIGGPGYTLGLCSNGTMVATGELKNKVHEYANIKLPADRDALLAAIELDYITE